MKRTTTLLALLLAAGTATATQAADWNKGAGGIKDHGGLAGVPVPAPIPVMESFSWYVRADLGYAFKSQGSSTTYYALGGGSETVDYDRNEGPFHGSFGFGRYLTQSLRWDFLADYRGTQKTHSGPSSRIATTVTLGSMVDVAGVQTQSYDTNFYSISRANEVRFQNHTGLFNLYWDFNRGGGFNPYIGAGLGLAVRVSEAAFNENGNCFTSINDLQGQHNCAQPDYAKAGKPTNVNYGLAGALMTGFTYEVRQGILVDTGYRLAWQGGTNSINLFGGDKVTGGERTDHEVRAGLRWNVW